MDARLVKYFESYGTVMKLMFESDYVQPFPNGLHIVRRRVLPEEGRFQQLLALPMNAYLMNAPKHLFFGCTGAAR